MSMSIFLVFLKYLALLVISINAQNSGTDCSVDGQVGACIFPNNCALVANILQQSQEQAVAYLRRNHCGFEGSHPLVCCIGNANVTVSTISPSNEDTRIDLENNSLLPNDCGRFYSLKIRDGNMTQRQEYPWIALLEYQKPNGISAACGGVLISKRYVLTAAHCIKGKDLQSDWRLTSVRLGEYNTDTERDCSPDGNGGEICADDPVIVGVEEQIVHEEYLPLSQDQRYDIALVRFNRDVTFTNFIKPICLPLSNSSLLRRPLIIAGWGKTETRSASNIKLMLRLNLAENAQCEQTYSNVGVQLGYGQFCAGGQKGKNSCWSDSGGPLMTYEQRGNYPRWITVGVLSLGPSSCDVQEWPAIYTKVIDFVPWILSKLRP